MGTTACLCKSSFGEGNFGWWTSGLPPSSFLTVMPAAKKMSSDRSRPLRSNRNVARHAIGMLQGIFGCATVKKNVPLQDFNKSIGDNSLE